MRRRGRLGLAAALAAGLAGLALGTTATAGPETRTLRLYHINLHEASEITFKRDGKYLPDGLKKANWALRDWRRNEPTKMDPRLLDLLWEAYQKSGSHMPIHVIGGYRAPETNKMLRSRSSHTGVAEHSQHMLGKAVDFFIPDVPLAKLREIGLKMQIGGVGFYPRSGAPFVHFDVGSGRYWPRMSRQELARIFPDGKTIHLPADGKPLPGYAEAVASYKKRKGASELMVADAGSVAPRRSFLAALFGGGRDEAEDREEMEAAPAPAAKAAPPAAPPAAPRPAEARPRPPELPPGVAMADAGAFDATSPKSAEVAVAALAAPDRVPLPTHAPARGPAPEERNPIDAVLVAALAEEPEAEAGLPHGVPMPHERPVAAGAASGIAREIAAAVGEAPDDAAAAAPMLAAAFAPERASAIHAPAPHARPALLEASLDRRSAAAAVTARPAVSATPTGRGGRVAGTARPPKPASTAAARPSGSQTAIAALLVDPERRALETAPALPRAERLVADRPHDVLALGFAPTGGKPGRTARFSGRAVNFLPVRHID
ncbi:DUF882 domain-containing protein [Aureimonas flava]|uniref:DUF882 domain-containing protein n=1 Tax=Aureimonas flava TaxID=2320271 RepID=UPI001AEC99AE|nr:DUF882 domain-containing protein [Aureimonas flava]